MAAKKSKTAAPKAAKIDPNSVHATPEEEKAVRDGDAKADNNRPAARPGLATPETTRLRAIQVEEESVPAGDPSKAKIVDVTAANQKVKGFRAVEVVATRYGHYGLKRRRPGEIFTLGVVGNGYLPSWVKLANKEDKDPEVSRSRQVERNSTGEEIRADVERDAGTEVPTYLGGTQRLPSNEVI